MIILRQYTPMLLAYILATGTLHGQVTYQELHASPLPVRQVAGHSLYHYAWNTDQALYIMYDGTLYTHTSLEYTDVNGTHKPSVAAIEDLMMTGYGRLFLRTGDGHTLAFDEGVFVGGIPVESIDFSSGRDLYVESFALMDFSGVLYPMRQSSTLWQMQVLIDHYDSELLDRFQQLQPNLFGAFLGHQVYVNGETPAIGVGYDGKSKLKIHQAASSHFPCAGFTDVVTRGRVDFPGIKNPTAVINLACDDGRLAIVRKHLNNNSSFAADFEPQEWRVLDFPKMGHGKVLQIEAPKPFSTGSGDEKEFVFGRTDKASYGLFVINTRKETHCLFDTPGDLPLSDIYVDNPERLFLATGNAVYQADISKVTCAISTSTEEPAPAAEALFEVMANPVRHTLDLRCRSEEVAGAAAWQLVALDGRLCPLTFQAQGGQLSASVDHLPPGMYLLQMRHGAELQVEKLILMP